MSLSSAPGSVIRIILTLTWTTCTLLPLLNIEKYERNGTKNKDKKYEILKITKTVARLLTIILFWKHIMAFCCCKMYLLYRQVFVSVYVTDASC